MSFSFLQCSSFYLKKSTKNLFSFLITDPSHRHYQEVCTPESSLHRQEREKQNIFPGENKERDKGRLAELKRSKNFNENYLK